MKGRGVKGRGVKGRGCFTPFKVRDDGDDLEWHEGLVFEMDRPLLGCHK